MGHLVYFVFFFLIPLFFCRDVFYLFFFLVFVFCFLFYYYLAVFVGLEPCGGNEVTLFSPLKGDEEGIDPQVLLFLIFFYIFMFMFFTCVRVFYFLGCFVFLTFFKKQKQTTHKKKQNELGVGGCTRKTQY